jgi:N-carbamoyl-L-amino-acid hydrolase
MAKVAGEAGFCLDLRSENVEALEAADQRLRAEIARIERERPGIRFDLGAQSRSQPAALSQDMAEWVARGAAEQGDSPRRMLSGGSHCPEEGMDPADLARAVEAVHRAVLETVEP